jgi:hypothetical protein
LLARSGSFDACLAPLPGSKHSVCLSRSSLAGPTASSIWPNLARLSGSFPPMDGGSCTEGAKFSARQHWLRTGKGRNWQTGAQMTDLSSGPLITLEPKPRSSKGIRAMRPGRFERPTSRSGGTTRRKRKRRRNGSGKPDAPAPSSG